MNRIWTAKIDDFAVTVDCSLFIFSAMMSDVALHQPRFCMVRIDIQNTVDKDLRDLPPFFRNRPRRV
jgi:hypothetical protein